MQLNTMIKVGSLALNVAQDDKVRELFTMVHKGAKRRGLIGQMAPPPSSGKPAQHPVPFAPAAAKPAAPAGVGDLSQWLNADNAKKALGMAGQVAQFFIK